MDISRWLVYAAVALVSILSPGPATLLAISNSVMFGLRRVMFSSLGNVIGVLLVSSITMAGLGAVLKSSALLFATLKIIGAGYLIYLGFRQWRSKVNVFTHAEEISSQPRRTNGQLFTQGVMLAVTNPKAILFFTALFPQFLDSDRSLLPQFAILTGTFMLFSFFSLMTYGLLARTTRSWFSIARHAAWFNRVSGGLFMLLGVGLLRLKNARS